MTKISPFPVTPAILRATYGSVRYLQAVHPKDKSKQVILEISDTVVKTYMDMGFQSQKMQIWALLRGEVPPVNCIGHHEKGLKDIKPVGMKDAHAVFKGLERPCNGYGTGEDVLIYVTAPTCSYEHIVDMVCCARRVPLQNVVATIYVRMYSDWETLPPDAPTGEIIGWDLVVAEKDNPLLPHDHAKRYQGRIW